MIKIIMVLFLFISMQPVNANECRYETETITENGSIISTKEIKVCKEVIQLGESNEDTFWYHLMYKDEGTELFWNFLVGAYYILGGG